MAELWKEEIIEFIQCQSISPACVINNFTCYFPCLNTCLHIMCICYCRWYYSPSGLSYSTQTHVLFHFRPEPVEKKNKKVTFNPWWTEQSQSLYADHTDRLSDVSEFTAALNIWRYCMQLFEFLTEGHVIENDTIVYIYMILHSCLFLNSGQKWNDGNTKAILTKFKTKSRIKMTWNAM